MKRNRLILGFRWACTAYVLLTLSGSCSEEETMQKAAFNLLTSGPWRLEAVGIDGLDHTSEFAGFTLTFGAEVFHSTQGNLVWPETGLWRFEDEAAKAIIRSDGILVRIETLTASRLVMLLDWPVGTLGSGRSASVAGEHRFVMVR